MEVNTSTWNGYKAKGTQIFIIELVGRIISGWSVGKFVIIILGFMIMSFSTQDFKSTFQYTSHPHVLSV